MAQTVEGEAPSRRVSLTKAQRESEIGAELLSLCQAVTTDGSFSDEEISSLREWLQEHKGEDLPAISHLIPVVEKVIADGRITPDERRELFIAVETILPSDVRAVARTARRTVEQQEKDRLRLQWQLEKERQREERERDSPIERWDFMVAGSRYEGRPALINRYAEVGAPAYLVRDPNNGYSRNAIEVRTASGHQIGFVPEEDAADVAPLLDSGHPFLAHIKKILTGGRYPIPVVVAEAYRKDARIQTPPQPQAHAPRTTYRAGRVLGRTLRSHFKFALIVIAVFVVLAYIAWGSKT
ncbi:MAG: HIRAN domain-containing protein [Betaproteobacteria bacterium]|nr:HIRAN domain-containing protein [Betaproteobacteria bacterium]